MENTSIIATIIICTLLLGLFNFIITPEIPEQMFPTALEIAEQIDIPEVSEGDLTQEIHDKLFENDAWEKEAKVLALEELEDDDYEAIYDFLVDEDGENLKIDEEEDIEEVIINDVSYSNMDVDEKDGIVNLELKVYYENSDGDNKKVTLDATAIIKDNEVEDLEFE